MKKAKINAGIKWLYAVLSVFILAGMSRPLAIKAESRGNVAPAAITEDYEEEEFIIEDDTSETLAETWLTPYQEPLYKPCDNDFIYPRLSANEQMVYAALIENAAHPEKDAYIPYLTYTCTAESKEEARSHDPMTPSERAVAASAVLYDHPEFYWSQSIRLLYSYVINGNSYTVTVKVKFSLPGGTDYGSGKALLKERAEALLSDIDMDASKAVIALKVHDALIKNTNYDYEGQSSFTHSAYGAIVNGVAVCDGYAKAYKYLLNKCGITASVVTSTAHAWNLVELGGRYYETDVTWDDSEGTMDYFNLSTARMDDGYYHSRNNGSVTRYLPRAEGGLYTGKYMSHCGKTYENAGPAGGDASLSLKEGDKDGDSWVMDIVDGQGSSVRHSVYKAVTDTDAFTVDTELSSGSRLCLSRIYGIKSGIYDVVVKVIYDNGAVSLFTAPLEINGKFHTESVSVSPASVTMQKDESRTVQFALYPKDSTDPVTWESSDTDVATVDKNGAVKAVGKGTAVITVRSGSCSGSYKVTVNISPLSLSVPSKTELIKGESKDVKAAIVPGDADGTIIWSSSDTKIATVSADGKIKGISAGTCTITGTVKGTSIKASGTVRVWIKEPVVKDISITKNGVKLTWDFVPGASAYGVYRKTDGGTWSMRAVVSSGSWTDISVTSGKKYTYALVCLGRDKKTEISKYGASAKETYFYSPVKVSLSCKDGGLKAEWNSLPGITTYRVYYESGGSWKKAGDVKGTSYTFTGLQSGTTRKVKVRALYDRSPVSGSSNTPSLKFIKAPDVKSLSKVSSKKIKVTWNKSAGAEKYRVYYKEGNGSWKKLVDTSSTSYTWTKAKSGKTYTFRVRCITSNGKDFTSDYGVQKSIKT